MNSNNPLQKQLDEQKFLHGVSYVEQAAGGPKLLTTSELAYLNQLITGKSQDPWRLDPVAITLRSGQTHQLNVLNNPIVSAREIIGEAFVNAGNGDLVQAAFSLYSQLILQHLFHDANRRTAALAVLWLVLAHRSTIQALDLVHIPVGDLRDAHEADQLLAKMRLIIR